MRDMKHVSYDVELGVPIEVTAAVYERLTAEVERVSELGQIGEPKLEIPYRPSWEPQAGADDGEYYTGSSTWQRGLDHPDMYSPFAVVFPENCGYGDYHGSMVDKANMASVADMLPSHWIDGLDYATYYSGYGSQQIGIRVYSLAWPSELRLISTYEWHDANTRSEDLLEALESLEDYPILDESKLSELETEAQNEEWTNNTRGGFRSALNKKVRAYYEQYLTHDEICDLDEYLEDDVLTDALCDDLGRRLYSIGSVEWQNEQGDSMYLDAETLADEMDDEMDVCNYKGRKDYSADTRAEVRRDLMKAIQAHDGARRIIRRACKRWKRNADYGGARS